MAKNPRNPNPTKKHLARIERERIQRRYLMIGASIVLILVVGVILFGILNETVIKNRQPVAIVNGERISTIDFQKQTRYIRQQLIGNAINTYQFIQLFQDSPETASQFVSQLSQVQTQLQPATLGQQVLDQMIDFELIRQEAKRRGITVSEAEIDQAFQEAFGYFPEGTPTTEPTIVPEPTSTLSPMQLTLVPPTPTLTPTEVETEIITSTPIVTSTATATVEPTPPPTLLPSATPTEFTEAAFQDQYQETVDNLKEIININESDFRQIVEDQLYREKVAEAIADELAPEPVEEQVWARHILVPDANTAQLVLERLAAGEVWSDLAAELSTDDSNKNRGGDLGWFGRGRMVAEFEEAAFSLDVGESSEPVQTQFGWHIIQVVGHEDRPLNSAGYEQLRSQVFEDWLLDQQEQSEIEIRDYWSERVPTEPTLPEEIVDLIAAYSNQQQVPVELPIE